MTEETYGLEKGILSPMLSVSLIDGITTSTPVGVPLTTAPWHTPAIVGTSAIVAEVAVTDTTLLNCGSAFVEMYDIISPVLIYSLKSGIPAHAKLLPPLITNSNPESNVFLLYKKNLINWQKKHKD